MKKDLKVVYESPAAEVVDVTVEGIICQSGVPNGLADPTDYGPGIDPFLFV